jgi:hypothetical protein
MAQIYVVMNVQHFYYDKGQVCVEIKSGGNSPYLAVDKISNSFNFEGAVAICI